VLESIDDHSWLIPFAAYFLRADTQAFHQTVKEVLRRRGLPAKLYTDQGGPFTNDHTRVACANLGIRLLHAKPYHAWSREKPSGYSSPSTKFLGRLPPARPRCRRPHRFQCHASVTIVTTAAPTELADGFGAVCSAGWKRRSKKTLESQLCHVQALLVRCAQFGFQFPV
jgi:hypothetical protein